jgi:hypothetical protein
LVGAGVMSSMLLNALCTSVIGRNSYCFDCLKPKYIRHVSVEG